VNEPTSIIIPEVMPDQQERISKAEAWATDLAVTDNVGAEMAVIVEAEIGTMITGIKARFAPAKSAAHKAHKEITFLENSLVKPLESAKALSRTKRAQYQREIDAAHAVEQARLQAAAEAEAERKRVAAVKAAEKLKTPELREQRLEEAAQIIPEAPVVVHDKPAAGARAIHKKWSARLVDMHSLVKAAADGNHAAQAMLSYDVQAANRQATLTRDLIEVPGVEFYEDYK